jgi:hypothetical protein
LTRKRLKKITIPQQGIIKGDAKSASIAASSILAKVTRDALIRTLDTRHPSYGFADHKGTMPPFQDLAHLPPINARSVPCVRSLACRRCLIPRKRGERPAKAMFETAAEVLAGLAKAFRDYEDKNEPAWPERRRSEDHNG